MFYTILNEDLEREITRKGYVASLETRTQAEIAEEEALYVELKRLEQNERRFKRDRDELLRTLLGIESGLPDMIADEEGLSATAVVETKKSRKKGELDTPVSASASSSTIALGHPVPKKQSAKSAAYGEFSCRAMYRPELLTASYNRCTALHLSYRGPTNYHYHH
jgi:DNA methyltransferase 1-associated protein 1